MTRRVLLMAVAVGLLLAADAPTKGAPAPPAKDREDKEALNLPEGVIHVSLPPGTIEWVRVFNKNGEPLLRVSVGKTVIEARHVFIGDGKAATEYEATKDGILWPSVKSRKGPLLKDGGMSWESGTTGVAPGDFLAVDKLKPGSLYLTTLVGEK
jgi:hypothetical protein